MKANSKIKSKGIIDLVIFTHIYNDVMCFDTLNKEEDFGDLTVGNNTQMNIIGVGKTLKFHCRATKNIFKWNLSKCANNIISLVINLLAKVIGARFTREKNLFFKNRIKKIVMYLVVLVLENRKGF